MVGSIFLGLAMASEACSAATLVDELRAEGLSFVELASFGKMRTIEPGDAFPSTRQLPDSAALAGASSAGDRLLLLADSHRTEEHRDTPKIFDQINVTTLDGALVTKFAALVHRMLTYSAELSPDGRSVAFLSNFMTRDGRGGYGLHLLARSGEIRTLIATTESKTPQSAGWSKDGRTIVYDLEGRILLYRLDTNTSHPLVDGSRPTWSPDGTLVAYRTIDGRAALISPDGTFRRNILGDVQLGWSMRWSPDSRYLLYTDSARGDISVLKLATGETATVFTPFDRNDTEAGWRWIRRAGH